MYTQAQPVFQQRLQQIRAQGLWKTERTITTAQGAHIATDKQNDILNMCSNNYLGFASDPRIIATAQRNLAEYGYGLSSVRFICGTQKIHQDLEKRISEFLHMENTILYSSCFDANCGLFESLLSNDDAIISDELNHASIIDGVRLCKARRYRYRNSDMEDLENHLKAAQSARLRLIVTDGVFSMDGIIANLARICDLAERYDALVMVDDSHAVGFIGDSGRGTPELCGVMDRVDIVTGTLGKALGGASGGYTSAKKEIVQLLRQVSRPYLFSNSLAPVIAASSIAVLDLLEAASELRERLRENTAYFATEMRNLNFDIPHSEHPIVPVMFYDAEMATAMASKLLEYGVYAIGFTYPVVPKGQARIRTQLSAQHSKEDIDKAVAAFAAARDALA